MKFMGYESYEAYRHETNRRQPHTEDSFRKKLDEKIDELQRQRDFRSLEMLIELADALHGDEEDREMNLYLTVRNLLTANQEQMHRIFVFTRAYLS